MSNEDLENRCKDLVIFAALSSIAVEAWKDAATSFVHTTSKEELVHLSQYVRRIEDTKLTLRLKQAMDDHQIRHLEAHDSHKFENGFYSIEYLSHFAENRYGIHLKRTHEFGIYSSYVFDDGRISHRFYRSDPSFQLEQRLEALHGVLEEVKLAR